MSGHLRKRGAHSWQIKFDVGVDAAGRRQIRYLTVRGTRKEAERELTKQLNARNEGTFVEPSKVTVAEYLRAWLGASTVSGKTLERYRQLAEQQIIPHLGTAIMQRLKPSQIQEWHSTLLQRGGKDGAPLSAQTVTHAHRVLHTALSKAAVGEIIPRNVASLVTPPKVESEEIEILTPGQVTAVLKGLQAHPLSRIVTLALATGMRRGEILGLQWGDIDLDASSLKVQRSVEETKAGLKLKPPKTKHGRRTISLPRTAVEMLRTHLREQRELRIALGAGRETPETLLFSKYDGSPMSPDNLSRDWARTVKAKGLPAVSFHALRHTHASALIASGLDVVRISRRLGHSSAKVSLTIYAHLFEKTDASAASAIEATLTLGA